MMQSHGDKARIPTGVCSFGKPRAIQSDSLEELHVFFYQRFSIFSTFHAYCRMKHIDFLLLLQTRLQSQDPQKAIKISGINMETQPIQRSLWPSEFSKYFHDLPNTMRNYKHHLTLNSSSKVLNFFKIAKQESTGMSL